MAKEIRRKRGRPPALDPAQRKESLTVHVTPTVRATLKAAADKKGISLSQELEERLTGSLADPEIYDLVLKIAEVINQIERRTGRKVIQDRYTLEAVQAAIKDVLTTLKVGPTVVPKAVQALYTTMDEKTAEALRSPEALGSATASTVLLNWPRRARS